MSLDIGVGEVVGIVGRSGPGKSTLTKLVNLTPGMAVTVEVKTGKRRLIELAGNA